MFPLPREALTLVEALGESVSFYKIGLELCMSGEYFVVLQALKKRGKKVFADMKFFDIPQTVGSAVKNLAKQGADFVTIHGDPAIIRAAAAHKGKMKVLAVTVLTSMDDDDLSAMGYADNIEQAVRRRALASALHGADGVIASGLEAKMIRELTNESDPQFLIVTPGIRLAPTEDDQKRTQTLEEAFFAGADYLVIGRPIRQSADPRATALHIQSRINAYWSNRD
jgi:orotidine-5'-phosphate decarboxylase